MHLEYRNNEMIIEHFYQTEVDEPRPARIQMHKLQ